LLSPHAFRTRGYNSNGSASRIQLLHGIGTSPVAAASGPPDMLGRAPQRVCVPVRATLVVLARVPKQLADDRRPRPAPAPKLACVSRVVNAEPARPARFAIEATAC